MSKKKTQKRSKESTSQPSKGFDLGEHMKVMGLPDVEFNQILRDAKIYACAYGVQFLPNSKRPIPSITLVGEVEGKLREAFQHFAQWGCESDGDVVDINMMLRVDGSYQMWIGPEVERAMHRIVPQSQLCRLLMMNVSYIKTFDSTHAMVRRLRSYCEAAVSPVAVSAASGDPKRLSIEDLSYLPDLPRLVKFDLEIVDERDNAGDQRFSLGRKQSSPKGQEPKNQLSPSECSRLRQTTLDIAFPVSRERVRRSNLVAAIRAMPGYSEVTETQVVQAAINLTLSAELVPGDQHYKQVSSTELHKTVWEHILGRRELADGDSGVASHDPATVAKQVELDVRVAFSQRGVQIKSEKFAKLQAMYRRKGYVDD